jgi:hypothetical protein
VAGVAGVVRVPSDPPAWARIKPGPTGLVRPFKGGRPFPLSARRLFREVFPDAGGPVPPAPPVSAPSPPPALPPAPPAPAPVEPPGPRPDFRPVPGFPGCVIDPGRSVWSGPAGDPPVWRPKAVVVRTGGLTLVHLRRDGRVFNRSVGKLYREAFSPAPVPVPRPAPLPLRGFRGEPRVGSAHGRAKLDEVKVAEARRLKRDGWTYPELAARYGVGKVTLFYAVSGRTWGHVPSDDGPP